MEARARPRYPSPTPIAFGETGETRGADGAIFTVTAMDDTLKRLLDAEMRAERLAKQAEEEQDSTIQHAMDDAKVENDRFTARIPDLHRAFIAKAEERAEQNIAELRRRYDERHIQLRDQAEQREDEALEAAFQILIGPER